MQQLSPNWLTEGLIDFEYKKYVLLAYLKHVTKHFNASELYPFLSDLVFHCNNLRTLQERKEYAANRLPKKLTQVDLEQFSLKYEQMIKDDSLEEIEAIIEFAMPKMKAQLREGREIYEFVENNLSIWPIGIVPLNTEDGYILIQSGGRRDTQVFEYHITIFETAEERYRGIKAKYVSTYTYGFAQSMEDIKVDLVKNHKQLANPATFAINSELVFPFQETLLPVAKRRLVRYLSEIAA